MNNCNISIPALAASGRSKLGQFIRAMAVGIVLVSTVGTLHSQLLPPEEILPGGGVCARGEVLIQFEPAATDAQIARAFQQGGVNDIRHVLTPAMADAGQIGVTRAVTILPVPVALNALQHLPGIRFAEPNYILSSQADANDPFYIDGTLWGLYGDDAELPVGPSATTNPFGSQAEKAWAAGITGSSQVFVGVVDTTGIQTDHPDLAANIWVNPGEVPGNGIDDDGNGYIDDVHGWNAYADNGDVYDTIDKHGTHVAGTVGAAGGNGIGIAGVNWAVSLISGKFGRGASGSVMDAAEAIDYMTSLRTRKGLNIVVLNNSYGSFSFSQAHLDSITRAAAAGILLTAAAMNWTNNNDIKPVYPSSYDTTPGAGYDAVISVAAIDKFGNRATFTDFGATSVDLGAPGVTIYSTGTNGYAPMSGTSMATPHVAGAIALYASINPGARAWEARADLLTLGVRATESLVGRCVTEGRLDIGTFLTAPTRTLDLPAPAADINSTVYSAGRVDISWTDQSDNELGFVIERSSDGVNFDLVDTVGAGHVGYSDRTVRSSSRYLYRLRAYNAGGASEYAAVPYFVDTPFVSLPTAPLNLNGTAAKGSITLSWSDRSNNEEWFQIERQVGTGAWQIFATLPANTVRLTDTLVMARTKYSYRVRAANAAGHSAYSNEITVPAK